MTFLGVWSFDIALTKMGSQGFRNILQVCSDVQAGQLLAARRARA